MTRTREGNSRSNWLGLAFTGVALIACYGTLALVVVLSFLGISLNLHDGVWAMAIALFTLLAVASIALGWRRHGRLAPAALAIAGGALILWAMFGQYSLTTEVAGFAALMAGAAWDWRLRNMRGKLRSA